MTTVPYAAHFDAAAFLFRRRQGMLDSPQVEAVTVARLERRLRCHLHVLGRVELPEQRTEKAAEFSTVLAADLSSPSPERRAAGVEKACRWLCEGGKKGEGAFGALALFPPPAEEHRLTGLYRAFPPLRPVLFRLWRVQGASVPTEFLDGLQAADSVLKEAALWYAAENPAIGAGFFRPFWLPLLDGAVPPPAAAVAPLWGALLRGEKDAAAALRRGTEMETSERGELLRLGALAGDPALLPPLDSFCAENPQAGVRLLSIHGTKGAASLLLKHLPQAPEEGRAAWKRLTGEELPSGAELPRIVEAAVKWWKQNQGGWPEGERRMAGRPPSPPLSASLARVFSGQAGRDYFDQTSVLLGRPLGCFSGTWQETRRAALERAVPSSGEPGRRSRG